MGGRRPSARPRVLGLAGAQARPLAFSRSGCGGGREAGVCGAPPTLPSAHPPPPAPNTRRVRVHNISPGMVTTDLLMAGADNAVAKFFM